MSENPLENLRRAAESLRTAGHGLGAFAANDVFKTDPENYGSVSIGDVKFDRVLPKEEERLYSTHPPEVEKARKIFDQQIKILKGKNSDYTCKDVNFFANFEDAAEKSGITTEQGIFNRFCDKVNRISTAIRGGNYEVESETINDAISDAINYLVILQLWRDRDDF